VICDFDTVTVRILNPVEDLKIVIHTLRQEIMSELQEEKSTPNVNIRVFLK
jgi:hypothetical protein